MSEARAIVNLIGNGIATVVVQKVKMNLMKRYESNRGNEKRKWSDKKSALLTFLLIEKGLLIYIIY